MMIVKTLDNEETKAHNTIKNIIILKIFQLHTKKLRACIPRLLETMFPVVNGDGVIN